MKIKNHDDFPKLDHRTAPSFRTERDWVIDSPPIPRARPEDWRHDQRGNFQTALLGRITPASTLDQHDPGRLHEQDAQVAIAALGNLTEYGAVPGRCLLWNEAEPGAEVASRREHFAAAD